MKLQVYAAERKVRVLTRAIDLLDAGSESGKPKAKRNDLGVVYVGCSANDRYWEWFDAGRELTSLRNSLCRRRQALIEALRRVK